MYRGRPARHAPTSFSRNGTPWKAPRGNAASAAMARPASGSGTTTAFEHGVGGVDPRDRSLGQLGRRDLSTGDQVAQRDRVEPRDGLGHG